MAMYFCDGCQRYRESREHGFNEVSRRQLCDHCEFEREEAMREFIAQGVAEHVENTRRRYEH